MQEVITLDTGGAGCRGKAMGEEERKDAKERRGSREQKRKQGRGRREGSPVCWWGAPLLDSSAVKHVGDQLGLAIIRLDQ